MPFLIYNYQGGFYLKIYKTDKRDKQVGRLRREIERLKHENVSLTDKISLLESLSNMEAKRKMEEAEQLFYQRIEEVNLIKKNYEALLKKQTEFIAVGKKKYKKQTNKAIVEFKESLSRR